jgi:mannosyltransferase
LTGVDVTRRPRVGLRQAGAALDALRSARVLERPWAVPASLGLLLLLSLFLRTRALDAGYWIDEGISVGIAHHHWTSIPRLMRQDGSPPAYYLLLGLWIRVFGDGERSTHVLSLLFALVCIPLAYVAARSAFGRTAGLVCAVLAALTPYLTYYAQETRMYTMEAALSLLAVLAYVEGVLRGRRWWTVALVPTLALMVYGHNWGLFFCFGLAVATLLCARERWRRFALVAGAVFVLYLPWLATLLSQAKHTGAPWATRPSIRDLPLAGGTVLGGDEPTAAFVVAASAGLVFARDQITRFLAASAGATIVAAWVASEISPAWASRYFGVVLGPVLLLAGAVVVRGRHVGWVAFVLVLFLWVGFSVRDEKENAREIAAVLAPSLRPGELVISTHPEQVPVLRYYLGPGLRWATTLGPVPDSQVFDWRDAVARLEAARPKPTLDALLATVPRGSEFVVVTPVFRDYHAWDAPWTHLVWVRSLQWSALLSADRQVRLERHIVTNEIKLERNYFKPVQAFVYRRVG